MNIRKAKKSDLDSLTKLMISFKEGLTKYEPKQFKIFRKLEKPLREIENSVRCEIKNKNGLFLVVENNGRLVGFIFGTIEENNHMVFRTVKYGLLKHIWIEKSYRNKGLASKLKKELLKWFKKNNCKYVRAIVLEKNPAKKIYRKWGFRAVLDEMEKVI